MKKSLLFLLCFLFLGGCAAGTILSTDASLETVSAELRSRFDHSDVTLLNSDYMLLLYGLDEEDYSEASAFRVKRLAFPDEIILLKADDEAGRERLLKRLNEYRTSVLEQSRIYEPESYAVIDKCAPETEGLYVWMFLSERNEELTALFRAHLKEYAPEEAPVFTPAPSPESTPEADSAAPSAQEPAPQTEPAAAAEPDPVPEPESTVLPFGLVPKSERADDSRFRDSIFVGTSVAENLRDYVFKQRQGENPGCMDNTVFFTAVNYSYFKALEEPDPLSPALEGDHCSVEDAVLRTGAKRIYLNLGYCDLVLRKDVDVNLIVSDVDELVHRIREKNPSVTVIILSVTPRLSAFDYSHYGSPRIRELNRALLEWTETHESYYIDCYSPLEAEAGGLDIAYHLSYGAEDGAHLNTDGARIWLDTLYTHTIP